MNKFTTGLTTIFILTSVSLAEVTKAHNSDNSNVNIEETTGYWGLHIGAGKYKDSDFSTTEAGFQIGVQKDFTSFVTGIEFDATFSGDTDSRRIDTYMGNIFIGYNIDNIAMPYALAGIGGAYLKDQSSNESTFEPSYQGGAGIRFFAYGTSYVDLGWRYNSTPDAQFSGGNKFDLKSNHFSVSIGTTF